MSESAIINEINFLVRGTNALMMAEITVLSEVIII